MKFTEVGKENKTVPLGSLKVGDTFIYDNRIGMMVSRNGHCFPLDLTTGTEFWILRPPREWIPDDNKPTILPSCPVAKVNCEVRYTIVNK
jgi:hypothetical protein